LTSEECTELESYIGTLESKFRKRQVKSIEQFGFVGPLDHWRRLRQRIHDDVCQNGIDVERGAFTQSYGVKQLDASLPMIALVGFLPPEDKRVRSTVEAIEQHLVVDGFVRRYDTYTAEDGLPAGEGAGHQISFASRPRRDYRNSTP
jgi:GH15 family glucan-1,4-alpha-glucosidase